MNRLCEPEIVGRRRRFDHNFWLDRLANGISDSSYFLQMGRACLVEMNTPGQDAVSSLTKGPFEVRFASIVLQKSVYSRGANF